MSKYRHPALVSLSAGSGRRLQSPGQYVWRQRGGGETGEAVDPPREIRPLGGTDGCGSGPE